MTTTARTIARHPVVAGGTPTLAAALGGLTYAVSRPVRHWLRRRQTAAALYRLPVRMLHDIGVEPSQIAALSDRIVSAKLPQGRSARAALADLGAAWRAARNRQRMMRELSRLDGRMLRDIGLSRAMIEVFELGLEPAIAADAEPGIAPPVGRGGAPAIRPAVADLGERPLPPSDRAVPVASVNDNAWRRAS